MRNTNTIRVRLILRCTRVPFRGKWERGGIASIPGFFPRKAWYVKQQDWVLFSQQSPLVINWPWYRVVRCVSNDHKPYKEHSLRRTGFSAWGVSSSLKIASLNLCKTAHWKYTIEKTMEWILSLLQDRYAFLWKVETWPKFYHNRGVFAYRWNDSTTVIFSNSKCGWKM